MRDHRALRVILLLTSVLVLAPTLAPAVSWMVPSGLWTAVSAAERPAQRRDRPLDSPAYALARLGSYVEDYYARAQSIMGVEEVTVQTLAHDFSADGHARRLLYDLRVEWGQEPGQALEARVMRELRTVDGRPPKPGDEPECLDPKSITPEPLGMLLREQQEKYEFNAAGAARMDNRDALVIDYKGRGVRQPPVVTWREDCASIDVPGRTRGRVWLDPASFAILRLDEGLSGMIDVPVPDKQQRRGAPRWLTVERSDTTIRYRAVHFENPEETVMLPALVETLTVIRNAGAPRVRTTHRYSNYQRFVTEGRILR